MCTQAAAGAFVLLLTLLHIISSVKGHVDFPFFSPGIIYQYRYVLDVQAKHRSQLSVPESRLRAEATVKTHLLWRNDSHPGEQLVHVQMLDFKIHQLQDVKDETTSIHLSAEAVLGKESATNLMLPFLFHWNSGKVEGLYDTVEGSGRTMDLKRGLVSLFQLQLLSGNVTEDDVSGKCQVSYKVSKDLVTKTKDLLSCIGSGVEFTSTKKIFGVQWQPTSTSTYSLKDGLIQSVVSEEIQIFSLNHSIYIETIITSRQQVELVSSAAGPAETSGQSIQEVLAKLSEKYQLTNINGQPLKRTCHQCPLLETFLMPGDQPVQTDVASASSTRLFHTLVQMLRQAEKRDVLHLLTKASKTSLPFLIDAAVAAQSSASLAALTEFLDFTDKKQEYLVEKFLYAAVFVPRPSKDLLHILEKLIGLVIDPSLMESGIVVIGAVVHNMCQMKLCDLKEVEHAKATLVEGLKKSVEVSQKKIYLLSMKNAKLPETIPLLLEHAENGPGVLSDTALSALQSFPAEYMTMKVKKALRRIFHQTQRKYERTSRLAAAEILLVKDPLHMDVINILLALDKMDAELAKLLCSKIQIIQHSQDQTRKVIQDILKDSWLNNYSVFSRTGNSMVFSGLLAVSEDMLATYGLEMLFTETGNFRQSISDITLVSHEHRLQASQVSFEVQGLEFLMESPSEGDKNQEIRAGISVSLLDVQLRPIVFFHGYTDLLSKLFGSTGKPTTIVKGNILLIDHLQRISLQSGLLATIEVLGGLGLDISADLGINLWDQESEISIKTRAGLSIDFKAEVGTDFFQADVKTEADAELIFYFDTLVKVFEDPVQICLQLGQDQLLYRELFSLSESFPQRNVTHKAHKGRRFTVPGREFPLHHANSEMCKLMKALQPDPEL
uniref:Microsomal triglyceride transfer protein large subunit-like n=1 Tax=Geotrypetes seraphini TaxID=260995 RepID=A0A6P8RD07_GEOSA|nr:microsomal triglyceride transfer protein large subunit-like [Geotrypetes seraphini]XP_033798131.1 microsomal triglyceride transfer protein large subunit-like [Geotrypetes seraphini]